MKLPKAQGILKPSSLLRGTELYSFEQDRSLCCEEMASLLGFGHKRVQKAVYEGTKNIGEGEAREHFMNPMNIAHVGSVMASAMLALPKLYRKKQG